MKNILLTGFLLLTIFILVFLYKDASESNEHNNGNLQEEKNNQVITSDNKEIVDITNLKLENEENPIEVTEVTNAEEQETLDESYGIDIELELSELEILKENFLRRQKNASNLGKDSRDSFSIQSVFERNSDPEWSEQAIEHLYQLINSYPKQYKLQEKVTNVTCSDVMCAVLMTDGKGLSREKMRIHFLQNGGFPVFSVISKRDGFNGFYLPRFDHGFGDADLIQKKADD